MQSAREQLEDIESQKKHKNRKRKRQIPSTSEPRSKKHKQVICSSVNFWHSDCGPIVCGIEQALLIVPSTCNYSSTISLNCFVTVCSDYDIALTCVIGLTRIPFVEYVQHTFYTFVTFVLLVIMCMYILLVHKTKTKNVKMKKIFW